jgi:hypothetical protein
MRKALIFGLLLSSSAMAGTPTVHISPELTKDKAGCTGYLVDTIAQAFRTLNSPDAPVYLGNYRELEKILVKSGVEATLAKKAVDGLTEIHAEAFNYPSLQMTGSVFDDLVRSKHLLVCAVEADFSLANMAQNHMLFTEQNEAIILFPPPKESVKEFAVNFYSTLASTAAERILVQWVYAGFERQERVAGSADQYYKQFVNYNGGPLHHDILDQGFVVTFMSLYQAQVATDLFSVVAPIQARENALHMAKATYRELMYGSHHDLTAPIIKKLGITEENFFSKTNEILKTMAATILAADGR